MTYKDTALYIKLKVLSWITYDHLEIKMSNQVDEMWVIISSSEIMQTQPPPRITYTYPQFTKAHR